MKNPVYDYLHHLTVKTLVEGKQAHIVFAYGDDTVETAINLMSKNKVLSIPVVDRANSTCLGLVDMLDIVAFIISVAPDPTSLHANELRSCEIAGRAMSLKSLKDVVDASGRDTYVPVFESTPITMTLSFFAKGIHRVPIHSEGTIHNMVSQADVVREIANKIDFGDLKAMGEKTLDQLYLGQETPISVKRNHSVLKALHSLKSGISAIAVVEEDGKLAGNFSATNLEGLFMEQFPHFLKSVEDFLSEYSPASMQPVCCRRDTTFEVAIKEMISSGVHRLWVVNDDYHPIGVVSMTDILRCVANYEYK